MVTTTISFIVGLFVTSFTIIPICICLFFAIPFTRRLSKGGGLVEGHTVYRKYLVSIALLTFIYVMVTWFVVSIGSSNVSDGYFIGTLVSLIFGIWKTGANPNNMSEYLESNKKFLVLEDDMPK